MLFYSFMMVCGILGSFLMPQRFNNVGSLWIAYARRTLCLKIYVDKSFFIVVKLTKG